MVDGRLPQNLEEAVQAVLDLLTDEDKRRVADGIVNLMPTYHHGLGTVVRNDFKLWEEDSILHRWFRQTYGLWHADDMSGVILEAVQARLRGQEHDIEKQVEAYRAHWRKQGVES